MCRFVFVIAMLWGCGPSQDPVNPVCYQICVGNNLASKEECRRRCARSSSRSLSCDGGLVSFGAH